MDFVREVSGALRDVLCRLHGYGVAAWARQAVESIGVQVQWSVWGGGAGTERQFQGLPRISSFLLLLSLVIAPLPSPSKGPSSLGRASGSQVCFHFSDGNAPRAARRPNLVGAISAKPIQTVGQSHAVAAKPPKTCLHVRSNNGGCINSH